MRLIYEDGPRECLLLSQPLAEDGNTFRPIGWSDEETRTRLLHDHAAVPARDAQLTTRQLLWYIS